MAEHSKSESDRGHNDKSRDEQRRNTRAPASGSRSPYRSGERDARSGGAASGERRAPRSDREDRPRAGGDAPGAKYKRPYRPTGDDQRGARSDRRDEGTGSGRPSSSDRPYNQRSGAAGSDRRRDSRDSSWEERRPRSQDANRSRYDKPSDSTSRADRPRYDQPRREDRPRTDGSYRPRDDRPRREDRPREDRPRHDDRPRREDRSHRDDRGSRPSGGPRQDRNPRGDRTSRDDRSPRDDRSARHSGGSRDDRSSRPTGGVRDDRARASSGEDRRNTRPGQESRADRPFEPRIPEGITGRELDKPLREELRGLSKETAERVSQHMVAAYLLEGTDVETSQAHARFAARIGGRVGGVRETYGILAYRAGDYRTAVRELRTSLRITGRTDVLPMIADAERGMGRPERALDMAASEEASSLGVDAAIELMIVVAGAYADTGDVQTALRTLEIPALRHKVDGRWQVRLWAAYADLLERAERPDEAKRWRTLAADADTEGLTDAAERLGRPAPQVDQEPTWEDDEQVSVLDAYDPTADEVDETPEVDPTEGDQADDLADADSDSDASSRDDASDAEGETPEAEMPEAEMPEPESYGLEDAEEPDGSEVDGAQDDAEASDFEAVDADEHSGDEPSGDEHFGDENPEGEHFEDEHSGDDRDSEDVVRHDDQRADAADEGLFSASASASANSHSEERA